MVLTKMYVDAQACGVCKGIRGEHTSSSDKYLMHTDEKSKCPWSWGELWMKGGLGMKFWALLEDAGRRASGPGWGLGGGAGTG